MYNRTSKGSMIITAGVFFIVLALAGLIFILREREPLGGKFDGDRAMRDVERQVSFGPRTPGSTAHEMVRSWILDELQAAGWSTQVQEIEIMGQPIRNIIATRGEGNTWVIIGAHYDTRITADRDSDPVMRDQPVPGANDGASGVAVLLEIARKLPEVFDGKVWLVFFDAEDNGDIPGWDWVLGSTAFVNQLSGKPDAAVIVDMVGDADLNIPMERNSDMELTTEIWQQADNLGYGDIFIRTPGRSILDDHIPFLRAGIPAVDIIDFDYPYWHTTADTPDKVSADSLKAVGDTLLAWLVEK